LASEKSSKVKLPRNKIDFALVEKNSANVENLPLYAVEEIMRLARYYSGVQLFTAPYDVLFFTVQNFLRITHIPRGKLSSLVQVVTGQKVLFLRDPECSLFYAIYVAKELELRPLGGEEFRDSTKNYIAANKKPEWAGT